MSTTCNAVVLCWKWSDLLSLQVSARSRERGGTKQGRPLDVAGGKHHAALLVQPCGSQWIGAILAKAICAAGAY